MKHTEFHIFSIILNANIEVLLFIKMYLMKMYLMKIILMKMYLMKIILMKMYLLPFIFSFVLKI